MYFNNVTINSEGICISTGGNSAEKTNFGNETVSKIDASSSVLLNGTTVEDKVDAGGSIKATNSVANSLHAGGSITVVSSKVSDIVYAGGSIKATNSVANSLHAGGSITVASSKISDKVRAGGSIKANTCEKLGNVYAGGYANIDECASIDSIFSGGCVTLQNSTVLGNVSSETEATVQNSKINGTLSCPSNHLVIENSIIDTIDLSCANSMSINGGTSISGTVRFGNNVIIGNRGNCDNVFINGIPLSQLQQPKESSESKQILDLKNCTVKNIIFRGGKGEVILSEGSTLSGNITGGKVNK